MAAVPAGCSRGPWDWWEWQKRASDSSSRGSGDQPRVLPRPSSRVPLARTNFWLSLLGLLAKIQWDLYLCMAKACVRSSSRGSGDQPRVLPRPSSRVPLARTNFWLSLLGLLAKIKCIRLGIA